MEAILLLEDGTIFRGKGFGARGEMVGEVVFSTGMTGYQEVLSDPSYCGQIVTMTYPLIGNYGITRSDFESVRPFIHGMIVREYEEVPSNWRAEYTIDELLADYGIPGISEIDTRQLTRHIRSNGTMKGVISTSGISVEELKRLLDDTTLATDQVKLVSSKGVYNSPGQGERIVVVDFGAKHSILGDLIARGCDVVVVPHDATAEQIRRLRPDGVVLSNGPGNPKDVPGAIATIRELLGHIPLFGICLGHQLLALACGADTEKLQFGHRGGNHPVKDLHTGRCYITAQNHGYVVSEQSLGGTDLIVTHINNNDKSIEGLRHAVHPAFSVQFHPELSPEPSDSSLLFDQFIEMIHERERMNPTLPSQARFTDRAASNFKREGDLTHA